MPNWSLGFWLGRRRMYNQSCFIVIVDTDSYAGNFERDLVAWMTGLVGDCEVGEEYAELARAESAALGFDDGCFGLPEAIQVDEQGNGCWRPASIWEVGTTSVAVAFREDLTEEQFNLLAARARSFKPSWPSQGFQVINVRAIKRVVAKAVDSLVFTSPKS